MKKHLHKFESTLWLGIKFLLYFLLLLTFIIVLGKENIGLTRLSRTMGTTVFVFVIVGLLLLSVYAKGKIIDFVPLIRSDEVNGCLFQIRIAVRKTF